MIVILTLLIILNVLDVYNTLTIIAAGGVEVNPFMNYFLQQGVGVFALAKFTLSFAGLLTFY